MEKCLECSYFYETAIGDYCNQNKIMCEVIKNYNVKKTIICKYKNQYNEMNRDCNYNYTYKKV
jgi:ribosomal protein L21